MPCLIVVSLRQTLYYANKVTAFALRQIVQEVWDAISIEYEKTQENVNVEEKHKELKRKRNRERQRAFYHHQKDLKKNEEKKIKLPKTNGERQMELAVRKAGKFYVVIRNSKRIYNERGQIAVTGKDLCDCLDENCPGCHFPCPKCNSNKCGHECRVNRKWMYEKIEIEGNDFVIKNVYKNK